MATKKQLMALSPAEFNHALVIRFPQFFPNIKDLKQSLMAFGCEINAGWRPIVWKLTEDIEKQLEKTPVAEFEIVQVKEKFGGLRYYTSVGNDKIFKMINNAEEKSFKTCEKCGEKGSIDARYSWILTLCTKCKRLRKKEKDAAMELYLTGVL